VYGRGLFENYDRYSCGHNTLGLAGIRKVVEMKALVEMTKVFSIRILGSIIFLAAILYRRIIS
jgi:predicted acyltransferase